MYEIVQLSTILTLISTHHVTLTMNDLKNIFAGSIINQQLTELEIIKINPPILEILFSLDFYPDFANYGY